MELNDKNELYIYLINNLSSAVVQCDLKLKCHQMQLKNL